MPAAMPASAALSVLVLAAALVGCTPDEPDMNSGYGEIALSEEEQAEIDAILDSARTAAADAALADTYASAADDPTGDTLDDLTDDTLTEAEPNEPVRAEGMAAGGVATDDPATDETARAWPEPEALRYRHYRNAAHGYGVDYPDNLFQWGEAIGGDRGQAFETADGSATLLVYATQAEEADALRAHYESELDRADHRVTYQVLRPNWFVVSGYAGPYIFYQRTFRDGDALRTFELRHLARDKDYFGPITERLSHSFTG